MVFAGFAAGRDLFQLWKTTIARRNALASLNSWPGNPTLRRIVHVARDHVPLCSYLQIPIIGTPRSQGFAIGGFGLFGGRNGILRYDHHRAAALGKTGAR